MRDTFVWGVETERVALIEAAILRAFGPGSYTVRVNTQDTPWWASVIYWQHNKALTGPILPDQAADLWCTRVLAGELRKAADAAGLLEQR